MAAFTYRAYDSVGKLVEGVLDLQDEAGVASELEKLGYSIVEIRPKAAAVSQPAGASFNRFFERIDKQELAVFSRQMATLARSGTSLLPSLETVCGQTVNKKFKAILEDVRDSVQAGLSFSKALAKHPKVFSELFVSMVEVAETGGIFDKVLDRLAQLSTQEMEINSRIRSAMVYPLVLVSIAFLVVNFIMIAVMPKFVTVFRASNAALPLPTQLVLGASWLIRNLWPVLLLATVAIGLWSRAYIRTEGGRRWFHTLLLKLPLFGPLYMKVQVARFCRTLSALTASGVPLLQGLSVVERTISNVVIRKAIADIRNAIMGGSSLAEPFRASGLFAPMVVQMISVGEKSGNLDQTLEEIARFYDPEIEYTIKNMTALLEPFMLLVMGFSVGFIALSVLMPIFNLVKVFKS